MIEMKESNTYKFKTFEMFSMFRVFLYFEIFVKNIKFIS